MVFRIKNEHKTIKKKGGFQEKILTGGWFNPLSYKPLKG
jgi:hypothetical protein